MITCAATTSLDASFQETSGVGDPRPRAAKSLLKEAFHQG